MWPVGHNFRWSLKFRIPFLGGSHRLVTQFWSFFQILGSQWNPRKERASFFVKTLPNHESLHSCRGYVAQVGFFHLFKKNMRFWLFVFLPFLTLFQTHCQHMFMQRFQPKSGFWDSTNTIFFCFWLKNCLCKNYIPL